MGNCTDDYCEIFDEEETKASGDTISREQALDEAWRITRRIPTIYIRLRDALEALPAAKPTLREKALMQLLEWAIECDFGFDSIKADCEECVEGFEDIAENMGYVEGLIYVAERWCVKHGMEESN